MTKRRNRRPTMRTAARQSEYYGVYWNRARRQWESKMCIAGKKISLGMFTEDVDAAKKYDKVLRRLAELVSRGFNFPLPEEQKVERAKPRKRVQDNYGLVPRGEARSARNQDQTAPVEASKPKLRMMPEGSFDLVTRENPDGSSELESVNLTETGREALGMTQVGTTTEDALLGEAEEQDQEQDFSVEALLGGDK
jgi:hypothetical protein